MAQFVTVSSTEFQLDGILYDKVFQAFPVGNTKIRVVGLYEARTILIDSEEFTNIQIDGAVPPSQAQCISLLKDLIYSGVEGPTPSASVFGGTKEIFLNLQGIDTSQSELEYIAQRINQGNTFTDPASPFLAGANQILQFYTSVQLNNDQTNSRFLKRWYRVKPYLNSVGGANPVNTVSASDLMPDGREEVNPETNADLFIDLGDIGASEVWTAFNLGMPSPNDGDPWIIEGEKYITAVQNGSDKIWRFVGDDGAWGGDDVNDPGYLESTDIHFYDMGGEPGSDPGYSETIPVRNYSTLVPTIDLSNHEGRYLYMNSASVLNSHTTSNEKLGGMARVLISTVGKTQFPSVNSGTSTLLPGDDFEVDATYDLFIECVFVDPDNSSNNLINHFFIKR